MVEKTKTMAEKSVEIIAKIVKSRTIWASIASIISLIVALKTGTVMEAVDINDPVVTQAVELAGYICAIVSQILLILFRYIGKEMAGGKYK